MAEAADQPEDHVPTKLVRELQKTTEARPGVAAIKPE